MLSPMNIYEHFSCWTKVPVRLEHVLAHVKEFGPADEVSRYPVKFQDYTLTGGLRVFREIGPPYKDGRVIAQIAYPIEWPEEWQRIVCVKEMLHLVDPPSARSATRVQVEQLVRELTSLAAPSVSIGLPTRMDLLNGHLALVVLAPRAAIDDLWPMYKSGRLTVEAVAEMLKIPSGYARTALTDEWLKVVERVSQRAGSL